MKFDWSKFTSAGYTDMLMGNKDYCGTVHIGDICIELIVDDGTAISDLGSSSKPFVMCNFYVAHEDTGYGYKDDVTPAMPYDYADGFDMEMPHGLSYDEFKVKAEEMFTEYIEVFVGDYNLVEHANKPLEIW